MKTKERTLYMPPGLETVELRNEKGFAASTDSQSEQFIDDTEGKWN